jgi:hypothetical protein
VAITVAFVIAAMFIADLALLWFYTLLSAKMGGALRVSAAAFGVVLAVAIQLTTFWMWEGSKTVEPLIAIGIANLWGGAVIVACLSLARSLGHRLLPFAARIDE